MGWHSSGYDTQFHPNMLQRRVTARPRPGWSNPFARDLNVAGRTLAVYFRDSSTKIMPALGAIQRRDSSVVSKPTRC